MKRERYFVGSFLADRRVTVYVMGEDRAGLGISQFFLLKLCFSRELPLFQGASSGLHLWWAAIGSEFRGVGQWPGTARGRVVRKNIKYEKNGHTVRLQGL